MNKLKKLSFVSVLFVTLCATASASIDQNLKYGQKNTEVLELQEFLIDGGFLKTAPTNFFGLLTLKAVKAYQVSIGLPSTGYVGVLTRQKINDALTSDLTSSTQAESQETGTTTPNTYQAGTKAVVDYCKNIEGMQSKVPDGMFMDNNGTCFTPATQTTQYNYQPPQQQNSTPATNQSNGNQSTTQTTDTTPPTITKYSIGTSNSGFPACSQGAQPTCLYFETDKPTTAKVSYFPTSAVSIYNNDGAGGITALTGYASNATVWTDNTLSTKHVFNYGNILSSDTKYYVSTQVFSSSGTINDPPFGCSQSKCYWNTMHTISGAAVHPVTVSISSVTPLSPINSNQSSAGPLGIFLMKAVTDNTNGYFDSNLYMWKDIKFTVTSDDFKQTDIVTCGMNANMGCNPLGGYAAMFAIQNGLVHPGKLKITVTSVTFTGVDGNTYEALGTPLESNVIEIK